MAVKSLVLEHDRVWVRVLDRIQEILLHLVFLSVPLFFIILTRDQFELPKLTVLRVLTAAILGVWGLRCLAARRWTVRATPLDRPMLAWVLLQLLTTVISVSRSVSFLGEYENFRGLITVLNYPILFYALVAYLRSRVQIQRLLFTVLVAALLTTAYGIAQFFGIDFIAWNPTSVAKGRYFASLGNPNFLAAYLAMVMPLVVVFFLETRSAFRRGLLLVSYMGMFFCLLGTWSRGGLLGLITGMAVMAGFGAAWLWGRLRRESESRGVPRGAVLRDLIVRYRTWLALVLAVFSVLVVLSATFGRNHMVRMVDTIIHLPEAVKVSRLHIWGPAVRIIADHPILGTGLDTFKTVFPRYATPDFAAIDGANVASRTAHNEILQVLAAQGVVGLAVVAWLTAMILLTWWRAYRRPGASGTDRLVLVGLLASWTAYSVQNVFSFGVVAIDTLYWLLLALFVRLLDPPEREDRLAPPQDPEPAPGLVMSALLRVRPLAQVLVVAIAVVLGWLALRPALADYAFNRGSFLRLQGRTPAAAAAFAEAARLMPIEVKYVVYKGLGYEELAKRAESTARKREWLAKAIATYHRSLTLNPTNAYYLGNLGRAYGTSAILHDADPERFQKAERYYRRAIHYAPVTVLFYHNLAVLYLGRNQEEDFDKLRERLAAFDPDEAARLSFTAGNHYYNLNELHKSLDHYRAAVATKPDYVQAYYNFGIVLAQTEGPRAAVVQWQKALTLDPDFTPAREMLKRYPGLAPASDPS